MNKTLTCLDFFMRIKNQNFIKRKCLHPWFKVWDMPLSPCILYILDLYQFQYNEKYHIFLHGIKAKDTNHR